MICKIQAVTLDEGGREEIREVACLERTDLKPETLGLTLAEGKAILKGLQAIVVEGQVSTHLPAQRPCPDCGGLRSLKGYHDLTLKTVFGALTIKSPRLVHCMCLPRTKARPSALWPSCFRTTRCQSCFSWKPNGPRS